MKRKLPTVKSGLVIMLVLVICSACNNHNKIEKDFTKEYETLSGEYLVLGLVNDTDLTEHGVVYLNSITDNLNIQFANLTDSDTEYILKLFLNYVEIPFFMDGNYMDSYVFTAKSKESLIIPVSLDENISFENSHILTVAVLTYPGKYAYKSEVMSNSYGLVMSYELANKNGGRYLAEKTKAKEPMEYLRLEYQGLMLNMDFATEENVPVNFPPYQIKAKPNDTVNVAYRAGNYENAEDVIIIVLVEWEQKEINNENFLHIVNKTGFMSFGHIEFITPLEKGEYEITAFIVESPYDIKNSDNFHFHDKAHRFTLIVE